MWHRTLQWQRVVALLYLEPLLPLTTLAQPITTLISPPAYHAWPRTEQSQDISGPIGIVDPATNRTTWHIFIDCSVNYQGYGGSNLAWCHMHSTDLFTWQEDPLAMRRGPPGSADATGLDTGSVFQHPNGTIYAVYEACNQTANYTARVAMEGDICYARAKDDALLEWDKLCYAPRSAATGGRITNPTCSWCRAHCPARCGPTRPDGPSPFPDIMALEPFRDPPAPWLHKCNASSSELCWWQPVASGGLSPAGEPAGQPTLLMYKNNLEMSGAWEFAVPGGVVNKDSVWWGNGHPGHTLSCPDVFQPPQPNRTGPPLTVFTSLYDNYVLGTLDPVTQLLEAVPPFSHTSALPLSAPGLSIMKSGGVGPSNANNVRSRRLYFGTVGVPPGCGIIVEGGVHGFKGNHTGFIMTLPRDLTIKQLLEPTPTDAGYRLLNAFVPELQGLRIASTHRHTSHVPPNSCVCRFLGAKLVLSCRCQPL
eukprot:COSAG02_NODE_5512_length_4270_cov_12.845361_4_plen_479_part_00